MTPIRPARCQKPWKWEQECQIYLIFQCFWALSPIRETRGLCKSIPHSKLIVSESFGIRSFHSTGWRMQLSNLDKRFSAFRDGIQLSAPCKSTVFMLGEQRMIFQTKTRGYKPLQRWDSVPKQQKYVFLYMTLFNGMGILPLKWFSEFLSAIFEIFGKFYFDLYWKIWVSPRVLEGKSRQI